MKTSIVGVTFKNEEYGVNRQDIIKKMSGNEKIYLKREPKNRFDSNAVAVMVKGNEEDLKIGYIKAELAGILADFWNIYKFVGKISEIRIGDEKDNKPWGISIEITKFKKNRRRRKKR